MLNQTLNMLFQRELDKLILELQSYKSEENIWIIADGISNSSGNLTLHLIGNLNYFFGKNVGNTGYVRDRPAEFSSKNILGGNLIHCILFLRFATVLVWIRSIAVTFLETEFLPYVPHPNVSDGILLLYTSPIPPCEEGEFTRIRQAFIRALKSIIIVVSAE